MLISRTPCRVSFCGGGLDYPGWSQKHGGLVIGAAINRYSYIQARFYPPFHQHKTRLVYREIETVNSSRELNHRSAKACIESLGLGETGLEIVHTADLPGRSGTGSSSTFVVGMLKSLSALRGRMMLPCELTTEAIRIEREVLGETVGSQDQTFASFGGLNVLYFRPDGEIDVQPLAVEADHVAELESHLMLFFTGLARTSSEIAATYAPSLAQREKEQFALMRLTHQAVDAVYSKRWERLGNVVDQSWAIKAGLSSAVTNQSINRTYAAARLAGAWGGKITGSGGGGCMFLVAPPEKQPRIREALAAEGCTHIPFGFDHSGSTIIFSDRNNKQEGVPWA